ncbi:MAG: tyrosine-type recombinase/integrase [Candidatus Velthaea sp.]
MASCSRRNRWIQRNSRASTPGPSRTAHRRRIGVSRDVRPGRRCAQGDEDRTVRFRSRHLLERHSAKSAQQAADQLRFGDAYEGQPGSPIFTDELGARISPKAATNAFARLTKKAGLTTTSLHSTRHTTATMLVRDGVDLRTVSAIMGHSNATVTLGIYRHVSRERSELRSTHSRAEWSARDGSRDQRITALF